MLSSLCGGLIIQKALSFVNVFMFLFLKTMYMTLMLL